MEEQVHGLHVQLLLAQTERRPYTVIIVVIGQECRRIDYNLNSSTVLYQDYT